MVSACLTLPGILAVDFCHSCRCDLCFSPSSSALSLSLSLFPLYLPALLLLLPTFGGCLKIYCSYAPCASAAVAAAAAFGPVMSMYLYDAKPLARWHNATIYHAKPKTKAKPKAKAVEQEWRRGKRGMGKHRKRSQLMRKVVSAKFTATAFDFRHISCLYGEEERG